MNCKSLLFSALAILFLTGCSTQTAAKGNIMNDPNLTVIDVRSAEEYQEGHLENALLLPLPQITETIPAAVPDKSAPIALYCRSGHRAGLAKEALEEIGYLKVSNCGGLEDAAELLGRRIVR